MRNEQLEAFGNIDIYLFDQLLKGTFDSCTNIIDVGCGNGRNSHYFLKNGFNVFGVDQDAGAIAQIRALARRLSPQSKIDNFLIANADELPFEDESFDLVICSAVLHFAKDEAHFLGMLQSIWRILKPGGFFFARLASDIGIESLVRDLGSGQYLLPDGSVRYLVNHQSLIQYTRDMKGELFEPIKTTNVNNLRAMTTWCVKKG